MTGIMVMSFAATTTAVYAKGDDDNTLTVWAWDQNLNIKAMNIACLLYTSFYTIQMCDFKEYSRDTGRFWQMSFLYAKMGNETSRDRFSVYR